MSLISNAYAAGDAAQAPQAGGMGMFFFVFVFFIVFYFMFVRPQNKRAKEHRNMIEQLKKGDEVVTTGGMLGKIQEVGSNFVSLEIADGMVIKVQKPAISGCMPKGTMKSAE